MNNKLNTNEKLKSKPLLAVRFFLDLFKKPDYKKFKFPKTKKDVWYNYGVWTKGEYPIVFDENKNYIECKIGLIVQMGITECGKKVFYKITGKYFTKGGDFYYPSDAINCDMEFSHVSN